jgi:hypothetical protein
MTLGVVGGSKQHINDINEENLSSFLATNCPAGWLSGSCQFPWEEGQQFDPLSVPPWVVTSGALSGGKISGPSGVVPWGN